MRVLGFGFWVLGLWALLGFLVFVGVTMTSLTVKLFGGVQKSVKCNYGLRVEVEGLWCGVQGFRVVFGCSGVLFGFLV